MTEALPLEAGSFFDLSTRAKFRVQGSDRLRFLNGQITNDLRRATEIDAIEACVLNAKGKVNAHLFISAAPDAYFLDTDAELRETLPARLDRYIIADDVVVEDVSDDFGIFHILDSKAPNVPHEWKLIRSHRFVPEGWDVWVKHPELDRARELLSTQFSICDEKCAESLRIELGIPRWGHELTDEIIPIEANLEARCVDYSKGCYIGQEVISRIKMSGQTNKRLCGLVLLDERPLMPGMRLATMLENGREVGWVTSADRSPRLKKNIGLGFVKRGFNAPGTNLNAFFSENRSSSSMLVVEVALLPFISTD